MSDGMVTVCPDCDSTQIARRPRATHPSRRWHCRACKTKFRDPARRESRNTRVRNGLARKLADMDPSEVGR